MSTSRPFAYNPSPNPPIDGTNQIGDIAIGVDPNLDYFGGAGGVQWWEGPDEDLGYIVAKPISSLNQPNPLDIPAGVAFGRSLFTEESFILLAESLSSGLTFASGNEASIWLTDNGYWNTWVFITPTPTPTPTSTLGVTPTTTQTVTETPTNTPTNTPTPTNTITPTNTETPTNTPTPSVTNTQTPTNTITPTQTPTNTETPTNTPTPTVTKTPTTPTPTPTNTPTPTQTPASFSCSCRTYRILIFNGSMTGNITYTDCLTGNQSSIPFDWYEDQTDEINVCACLNTVTIAGYNEGSDYGLTQTAVECTLNQNCTCYEVTIDQQDLNNSQNNTVYLRVQECDGSWSTRTFSTSGTTNICIMNLWSVSGAPSLSMYILQGGNITAVSSSTATNSSSPCTGTIC
jgi:hypothetical protein